MKKNTKILKKAILAFHKAEGIYKKFKFDSNTGCR